MKKCLRYGPMANAYSVATNQQKSRWADVDIFLNNLFEAAHSASMYMISPVHLVRPYILTYILGTNSDARQVC